jgi:hypothetical protein
MRPATSGGRERRRTRQRDTWAARDESPVMPLPVARHATGKACHRQRCLPRSGQTDGFHDAGGLGVPLTGRLDVR